VAGLCQSRLWGGPSWKQVIPYLQNFFMSGSHSFFDSLQEHIDYELVESTNPAFNKAIVRVNIFRQHRQTIQVLSAFIFESSSSPSILKIQVLLDYI
jgi:hypothetical protein